MSDQPTRRRRIIIAGFATMAALGVGLALLPSAQARWGHGWHRPPRTVEELRERMHAGAERVLSLADANDAQEKAFLAVVDRIAPEVFAARQEGREVRDELIAALGQKQVDAQALQEVRTKALAHAESITARGVEITLELANILTPEQRGALVELHERWHR